MLNFFIILISIITLIIIVIGVHELGHFLAARKFGVHVIRFKIGFGKTLLSKFDKKGTEYSLGILPLGGYVQMLGEENPLQGTEREEDSQSKQVSYPEVSLGARAVITAAGPIANFLLAIFIFFLVFLVGTKELAPVVGYVHQASLAEQVGLEVGDRILSVDKEEITSLSELNDLLVSRIGESGTIHIKFLKEKTGQEKAGSAYIQDWLNSELDQSIIRSFGIERFSTVEVSEVIPGGSAEKSGLLKGDKILEVGKTSVHSLTHFVDVISQMPETSTLFLIKRDQNNFVHPITIGFDLNDLGVKRGLIGVGIKENYDEIPEIIVFSKKGPFEAIYLATEKTYKTIILLLDFIGKMITGSVSSENIGGPIEIGKIAALSAKAGLLPFISMIALISINLGLINLLPIPILDGGQLVLIAIEKIKGSPPSQVFIEYTYRIGLLLVISLMLFAVFNDISRMV
ncbi:MAG: RIP metalloprotease RseP [SAR86 cluster bacterium]|jgi:regulator of sigma E protease|nr:RIP metalloprotease RseP [SAR86 cluster bacterium]